MVFCDILPPFFEIAEPTVHELGEEWLVAVLAVGIFIDADKIVLRLEAAQRFNKLFRSNIAMLDDFDDVDYLQAIKIFDQN